MKATKATTYQQRYDALYKAIDEYVGTLKSLTAAGSVLTVMRDVYAERAARLPPPRTAKRKGGGK